MDSNAPSIKLSLIVIRVEDLARSRSFYESLGLRFTNEKHGNGPEHFAAVLNGAVFEIYPLNDSPPTSSVRIGFQVLSVQSAVENGQAHGGKLSVAPKTGQFGTRAVLIDPDGHRVELTEPGNSSDMK